MKKIFLLILIIISVAAIHSCKKNEEPGNNPTSNTSKGVYVSGIMSSDTIVSGTTYQIEKAVYWKNGTPIVVGGVGRIAVSGSDIYLTGSDGYYKNGNYIPLQPVQSPPDARFNRIVISGSDVYVTVPDGSCVAKYWKNGNPISITTSNCARAISIAVSGGDVYVAGYEKNSSGQEVAKYWKNGNPMLLTGIYVSVSAIAVSGSDVYVAGFEWNGTRYIAKYWKNGTPIPLTDGSKWSETRSITVSGSDVYVLGFEEETNGVRIAKYWKNGTAVPLAFIDGSRATAESFDITVSGHDVYVAGYILSGYSVSTGYTVNKAVYWKNGTPVTLGKGYAYGIAVAP